MIFTQEANNTTGFTAVILSILSFNKKEITAPVANRRRLFFNHSKGAIVCRFPLFVSLSDKYQARKATQLTLN